MATGICPHDASRSIVAVKTLKREPPSIPMESMKIENVKKIFF